MALAMHYRQRILPHRHPEHHMFLNRFVAHVVRQVRLNALI